MNRILRQTKIVATVGPASSTEEAIAALVAAGVDVFRLNFSHGTHDAHALATRRIREAGSRAGRHIGVMQDLSGPKIRTGPLEGGTPIALQPGDELRIAAGDSPSRPGLIYTTYAELIRSAKPADRLLLDDGRIELRVTAASPEYLEAVVVNGGQLGAHKGINAPGVSLPASALTDKDRADLRFGLRLGVDFVALSFVQTAADVRRAAAIMSEEGRSASLIAKIERPAAVDNLAEILRVAQGVMVARGDLGLEMPLERVPRIQKEIISFARAMGRPAILATQVFESMRSEPRPTRAEVSDAANAVFEGADAIMLAGETAVGAFPVRTVQTLDTVIRDAEAMPPAQRVEPAIDPTGSLHGRALCEAAVTLSTAGHADAILAVTTEGKTARLLASLRPASPIVAATPDEQVAASLTIVRGVHPFVTPTLEVLPLREELLQRQLLRPGSVVVFANVSTELGRADPITNFLHIQKI